MNCPLRKGTGISCKMFDINLLCGACNGKGQVTE